MNGQLAVAVMCLMFTATMAGGRAAAQQAAAAAADGDDDEPAPPAAPPPPPDDHAAAWSPDAAWRPVGPASEEEEEAALAELLNMSATVASKNATRVSRSPGMVTVYGDQDIRRLGYYSLAELADVTAGYGSHVVFGEKVFESRGQKAGSFNNNKHLILIDGIPMNHARGNKAMADHNLPLFFADRVEFLRGPASALYGTGAFFGVVNVAPKELEHRGFRAEARAGLGTEEADKRIAANVLYRDGVRRAAIHAGFFDKGPSAAFTGPVASEENRFWDNQRSEFLYLGYGVDAGRLRGLKAGLLYSSKNGGLGEHWLGGHSPDYDDLTWTQLVPYLKYDRRLTRSVSLDGYFKASRDTEKATAAAQGSPTAAVPGNLVLLYDSSVSVYEGLVELRFDPSPLFNLIAGGSVNFTYQADGAGTFGGFVTSVTPGPVFKENRFQLTSYDVFQTYSAFGQLAGTLPVLAGLHVTAGARLDTGNALDARFAQLSPRVGLVQELTELLGVKLLYHTALRAPGVKELGLNKEVRPELVNPELAADPRPETIRSLEAGLVLTTGRISASAAAFANETRDALNGRRTASGLDGLSKNIFTNTPGAIVARGVEVELTLARSPDARVFANYAYSLTWLRPPAGGLDAAMAAAYGLDLADVPIHKVNGGASYRLHAPLDLAGTLVARFVAGYRGAPASDDTSAGVVVPPSDPASHLVVDANLIARLTENASLELQVRNVADRRYRLPQGGVPWIPMPRRTFHLTLDYRW